MREETVTQKENIKVTKNNVNKHKNANNISSVSKLIQNSGELLTENQQYDRHFLTYYRNDDSQLISVIRVEISTTPEKVFNEIVHQLPENKITVLPVTNINI